LWFLGDCLQPSDRNPLNLIVGNLALAPIVKLGRMRRGMPGHLIAKPPKLEDRSMVELDHAQAVAFLKSAKGHRLEAVFTVALSLAMREGEILGLQ
jgi:integrase